MLVDGVELLRMIRDGEIKDKTRIKNTYKHEFIVNINEISDGKIISIDNLENEEISLSELMNYNFEILSEEDEEIDIEAIEEPKVSRHMVNLEDAIYVISQNEKDISILKKAVKQLNRQLNKQLNKR